MAGDNPCFEAGLCQTRGRNRPTSGSTHTIKPACHFCPTHQGPMHGTGRRECETGKRPRNRRRLRVRPHLLARHAPKPATGRRLRSCSPTLRLLHLLTALVDDGGAGGGGRSRSGPSTGDPRSSSCPRRLRPGPEGRAPDLIPAGASRPNFHLFLKGVKLRLDAEIGSLAIVGDEFIVLVPFTRMPQQRSSVCTASQEQGLNPPKQPEVSSAANSAWQDIMDDLSAMPTSPQSDAASKDFYSSCDPFSGRFMEDMTAGQSSSSGSSRKRRKTCKRNGNGSPQMVSPEANGTAEKHNISKKSGVAKSAAMSCHDMHPLEPAEMVEHLKQGLGKEEQIVHIQEIPSREASFTNLPCNLSEAMREALKSIGISRLYSHQSQAIKSSISGRHIVVATSTSSGKSLCYNIPVLESLSQDSMACALYIFPTKALAQDQLRTLLEMKNASHFDFDVKIYDGDTPREDRLWIGDNAFIGNYVSGL
ncbi:unnamed protein product [Miscanthus lutarioriparius]|uniref:DEAD/DEAH-box helicase domain-containing protein n=1 Tax=Miscanthus lutarioriparius TaxID=422564 RepID=A0A811NIB0_9POAL|nr:unnamed protein product [Miscanthus lutarioriparius]